MIRDSSGNLYGTAGAGGTDGDGVVYQLDATGHETVLHSFSFGSDGIIPESGVIRDSSGNLYGTTLLGGTAFQGIVYKVDQAGNETVLYSFTGGPDGGMPSAGVILDSEGNLYGTTTGGGASFAGVVFKLTPAGEETVLYSFTGGADGGTPYGSLTRDSDGDFFGTATVGGAAGAGVVFSVDSSGRETVLYSFTGGADGGSPYSTLISDSLGNLYGTTSSGGSANAGVVFQLDAASHETVLHSFTGGADGANPSAGVIRDSAGNLCGTTNNGGNESGGVLFRLKPQ